MTAETPEAETVSFKSFGPKTWLPLPTVLVGAYLEDGRPNLTAAAWVGTCCSGPNMLCVSLRPTRAAFAGIKAHGAFTVCIAPAARAAGLDFCGIVSGASVDKFSVLGWRPVRSSKVDAPYAAECSVVFECKLHATHDLGIHTHFIGEIVDVCVRSDCLDEHGMPDIAKTSPVFFDPASSRYFGIGPVLGQAFSLGRAVQEARK